MKIKTTTIIIFLLASCSSQLQAQSLSWAKGFGRGDVATLTAFGINIATITTALARDASGNVYTTGSFTGTADFDPGLGVFNLVSGGGTDVFISKLDPNGNFLWALKMGGAAAQIGLQIALDGAGNIYVSGYYRGTPDFDPGASVFNITTSGNDDTFIAKLDPSGNFLWAKSMGGSAGGDDRMINSLVADAAGNVYFTGLFMGSSDVDPNAGTFLLTNPLSSFHGVYVAKWDATGNFVWAKQLTEPVGLDLITSAIKLDALGNAYIVGSIGDVVDFDPGAGVFNMGVAGASRAFLWVLNSAGNFLGALEFGGSAPTVDEAICHSVSIDAFNNIYLTGIFSGTADFDPGAGVFNLSSPNVNTSSLFIVKLNPLGSLLWAKAVSVVPGFIERFFTGANAVGPCGITITGTYFGTADFDPNVGFFNLSAIGSLQYLLQLDPNGNFVYALNTHFGFKSPLQIDVLGNMYGVGVFSGTVDFDLNPTAVFNLIAAAGGGSTFVVKLLPSTWAPNVISPTSACLNGTDTLSATTILGSTLAWYAAPTGGAFLGSGNTYITPVLTDTTTFYVQDSTCQAGPRTSITVNTISCVPLPITLLSFEVTNIQNKEVWATWTTTAEINNDYFTIERSTDAINFEPIGTKKGAGNSNQILNYNYIDATLNLEPQTSNTFYYRLKQTDFDGNYEYFDVKAVTFNKITSKEKVEVYPNPTTSEFFIVFNNNTDAKKVTIGLTDAVGKKIEIAIISNGNQQKVLLPMALPKGIYFLNLQTENERIVKKILKN